MTEELKVWQRIRVDEGGVAAGYAVISSPYLMP